MHEVPFEKGIRTIRMKTWRDFDDHIKSQHLHNDTYVYRGQADAKWVVESTLDRWERRFPTKPNREGRIPSEFRCPPATRKKHLNAFKVAARGKTRALSALSDREWWCLAQHYGLKTPLVDWTYSPYVALFFAFEECGYVDAISRTYVIPEFRSVYCALAHVIGDNETSDNPAPKVFSPHRELSPRLNSQTSVLMEMPEMPNRRRRPKGLDLESSVRSRFSSYSSQEDDRLYPVLTKIEIPNNDTDRLDCLKHLNKMNIHRASLFADLDAAASYINNLWELNFDTPMGWMPDA